MARGSRHKIELSSLTFRSFHSNPSFMCLNNLIHNRQSKSRAARKIGLKWFENSSDFAGIESHTCVANRYPHRIRICSEADRQKRSSGIARDVVLLIRFHRDLFDRVAIALCSLVL